MASNSKADQAAMRQVVEGITTGAIKLHDMMEIGQVVIIQVLIKPAVIIPNQPPQYKTMLLVKPASILSIVPQPGQGSRN